MSLQPASTTPAVFAPKLSPRPPRGCDFALICSYPSCKFVWYFASELEALTVYHNHEHLDSLRMFQRQFAPVRSVSGMVLWKYVWGTTEIRKRCVK